MDALSIKSLNDQDLIKSTERVVEQERKIVQVLIWHLQEIQDRKLFLSMGYTDMYECLIGHFKMSDTTAYGRIKVLKILQDVPAVSESLKTGELSISNIALAHSFIERHEKHTGEELTLEDKSDLMDSLKNKTTSEVKELLARCNPDTVLPYDEIRPLTSTHSQMKSTISKDLVEKIKYLKSLISHENINPTHEDLLVMAFDALIEKTEKKKGLSAKNKKSPKIIRKIETLKNPEHLSTLKTQNTKNTLNNSDLQNTQNTHSTLNTQNSSPRMPRSAQSHSRDESGSSSNSELKPKAATNSHHINQTLPTQHLTDGTSRYVPTTIKRYIFKRAAGKCEHIHSTGKRCSSRFQLQFDHVIAFSKGGKTTPDNMQLLCRVHNAHKGVS